MRGTFHLECAPHFLVLGSSVRARRDRDTELSAADTPEDRLQVGGGEGAAAAIRRHPKRRRAPSAPHAWATEWARAPGGDRTTGSRRLLSVCCPAEGDAWAVGACDRPWVAVGFSEAAAGARPGSARAWGCFGKRTVRPPRGHGDEGARRRVPRSLGDDARTRARGLEWQLRRSYEWQTPRMCLEWQTLTLPNGGSGSSAQARWGAD